MNAETKRFETNAAGDAQVKLPPLETEGDKPLEVYSSRANFELAQRIAGALSKSTLVPEAYQSNLPNCLIALEMSARIGCSPLMAMQNLFVIQGRPSWSSTFIIASINSCGRFSPLRYRLEGEGASRSCTAWVVEKATGEILEGPTVSMAMAVAEGWANRSGSKWKTLPELMLRYRAAAFFGRLFCPELLLGMHSVEEVGDIIDVTPPRAEPAQGVAGAKAMLADAPTDGAA